MKRYTWIATVALSAAFGGCTCGSKGSGTSGGPAPASASAPVVAVAAVPSGAWGPIDGRSDARFSAPIAAARLRNGSVVAAAFVDTSKSIALTSFGSSGKVDWTVDVLGGVAWSVEVELRVLPAADGAAVVWRGSVDGKFARYLVVVGTRGDVRGKPVEVGSALCATEDGLAWIDRAVGAGAEGARVRVRDWEDTEPHDALQLPAEPAPTLVCGAHVVYALVAGEDELTVTNVASTDGQASAPIAMSRDKDFPADDDSDNQPFTMGDELGLVRIGESGALSMRGLERGVASPWRTLTHKLSLDDDVVVAIDGDGSTFVLIYTHDQSELCKDPGSTGKSLHALRVDRATGAESRILLAPADCGKELGPFWMGAPQRGFVAAWVERGKRSEATSAPIRALLHRALGSDAGAPGRIEQPADAIVDAGCDAQACWAVALVRETGADGMSPEALRVVRYP